MLSRLSPPIRDASVVFAGSPSYRGGCLETRRTRKTGNTMRGIAIVVIALFVGSQPVRGDDDATKKLHGVWRLTSLKLDDDRTVPQVPSVGALAAV